MELTLRVQVEELPEGLFLDTSDEMPGLVAQGRTIAEALDLHVMSPAGLSRPVAIATVWRCCQTAVSAEANTPSSWRLDVAGWRDHPPEYASGRPVRPELEAELTRQAAARGRALEVHAKPSRVGSAITAMMARSRSPVAVEVSMDWKSYRTS